MSETILASNFEAPPLSVNEEYVEEYELVKRLPPKFSRKKNDVYISQRSNFSSQFKKVRKLFEIGHNEVFLHGLGAAVERVVNLALKIEEETSPLLKVAVTHNSMCMVDDLRELGVPGRSKSQCRNTPVIHIRIYKTDHIPLASPTNLPKHPLTKQRKKKRNLKP